MDCLVQALSQELWMGPMTDRPDNPFQITKSNNLTDEQIDALWVSPDPKEGINNLVRPNSPTAMFILGGKGSGKSHIMRYYSFQVQSIRFRQNGQTPMQGVTQDRFVGIYARCGGLDADRFNGKSQSPERWCALFAYYFELWVADLTLSILEAITAGGDFEHHYDQELGAGISTLFDVSVPMFDTVGAARSYLAELRSRLDYAVNNASLNDRLDAEIIVSRGKLFFGVPELMCSKVPSFRDVVFVYLLDEFENFTEAQQMYINTLIREKRGPTTFKIGSRLYGIRTHVTLSGGERNLEGSEYEELRLDERFRRDKSAYKGFAEQLLAKRLSAASLASEAIEPVLRVLESLMEEPDLSWNSQFLKSLVQSKRDRPHLANFRRKLQKGLNDGFVKGPRTANDVEAIIKAVNFDEYPLLEKLCILSVYQHWFRSGDVMEAALEASRQALLFIEGSRGSKFGEFVDKHKGDMVAQLLRENNQKQIYAGLDNFIRMSEGLPRSLITIMKHVYDWSVYIQEKPLRGGKISIRAQQRGVAEAADWFLDEMLTEGEDGVLVRSAIERLSALFRLNRFADKPIETSMIAFSVDEVRMDREPRKILKLAQDTSLIISVPRGQRARNSKQITSKLELNTMLAPRYDLPIARRGAVPLSPGDANIVFDYNSPEAFQDLLKVWEAKMTAPAFGRTRSHEQPVLL
jgi:hypothetical protein